MKLTVIGCAGSFPGPDSPCSSYLVEADGYTLLLDFGSGSLGALQRHTDPYKLDAILLTHLHADHIMDACPYVVMRRYAPGAPFPQVPLYGPEGTERRLAAAYGGAGEAACPSLSDVYDVHTLQPSTFNMGPLKVTVDKVCHPIETYGVRIEHDGRTLVYSSDTGQCEVLERLAKKGDVFLCEASYLEGRPNPPGVHLTGREAGECATKADVGRLLLTHLVRRWGSEEQTLAEARSAYSGPVEVVHSGATFDI
ncbi:MBL fold metallo-hydrolase [Stackebrandtia nassauensis]|uniref:Beta-lactamase domain protein n=1 Tax=Stackebrandtia nassauensis (strain DSM 44728 / CIP 108903 / NRRL B-16338 / NBRC 102104 / LLR-40K-21) TaxID=446470 RepID=D3PW90_STANL|nr:MBL fold metallo-hydrolase [Stackebrandtia nassauensis]ADD41247.1 beta-lactamase domain protein [Stackebrandtia nassauensis DSM 44728]